jgi:hypothetical protein
MKNTKRYIISQILIGVLAAGLVGIFLFTDGFHHPFSSKKIATVIDADSLKTDTSYTIQNNSRYKVVITVYDKK